MNSGEFMNDGFAQVIGALIPFTLLNFVLIIERIQKFVLHSDEEQVQKMIQRLGMRKSVSMFISYIVSLCILPICCPILAYLAKISILRTTTFWFILWNLVLYFLNVTFTNHIIRFMINNLFWANICTKAHFWLSVLVSLYIYLLTEINPILVDIQSFFLPLPAISWIVRLGIIASNKGIEVELFQSNEIVNGNNMT